MDRCRGSASSGEQAVRIPSPTSGVQRAMLVTGLGLAAAAVVARTAATFAERLDALQRDAIPGFDGPAQTGWARGSRVFLFALVGVGLAVRAWRRSAVEGVVRPPSPARSPVRSVEVARPRGIVLVPCPERLA